MTAYFFIKELNKYNNKIMGQSNIISAPYFWKMGDFTFGLWENFARSKNGSLLAYHDSLIPDAPKEIDMFVNYLRSL